MPFEYPCFVSYSSRGRSGEVIRHLHEALSQEMESYMRGKKIYFAEDHTQGGSDLDLALSRAICKSACMIVVFQPSYFDETDLYCAREFRAMERLEISRRKKLQNSENRLIIPIVVRGKEEVPPIIKDIKCYNFVDYIDVKYKRKNMFREAYGEQIIEIVKYVRDRYRELEAGYDISEECRDFALPTAEEIYEIYPWVRQICRGKEPFPFRGNQ